MVTLYIIRHGETEWNLQKRMQGWSDSNLTKKGISNAISLGWHLKNKNFQAIYSSTSKRALDTAAFICGERKIPIIADDNLREIHLGDWTGKTHSDIQANFPAEFDSYWNAPHRYTSVNGENFEQFQLRLLKALNRVFSENITGNVLIVTHAVAIKSMLALFKRNSLEKLWEPPVIQGTSLTVVEINGESNKIILEGDLAHLDRNN